MQRIGDEKSSLSGKLPRSCLEIEELWRRCNQEENAARQRRLEEFNAQQNQDSLRDQVRRLQERVEFIEESRIFQNPDSPSTSGSAYVPHHAHITSSSRKPCREPRMQRNTREDMSIPGNVFNCQPARRDPDELHKTSKNLAPESPAANRERRNLHERV